MNRSMMKICVSEAINKALPWLLSILRSYRGPSETENARFFQTGSMEEESGNWSKAIPNKLKTSMKADLTNGDPWEAYHAGEESASCVINALKSCKPDTVSNV